jgi:hypothetical protein
MPRSLDTDARGRLVGLERLAVWLAALAIVGGMVWLAI